MFKSEIRGRMSKEDRGGTFCRRPRTIFRKAFPNARLVSAALAILLGVAAVPLVRAQDFGAGLVGWWLMDEGKGSLVGDSSGLGNNGKLSGRVSFTANGLVGSALDFTGADGLLLIPYSAKLQPATGTIEVWVKVPVLGNQDVVGMVTDCMVRTEPGCKAGGRGVIKFGIKADGGVVAGVANDDPTTLGSPWRGAEAPPSTLTVGTWHHLAMRWDGSKVAVFVDGVLRGATPYNPVPVTGLSYHGQYPLFFGQGTSWGKALEHESHEFIGQLDDVRFYARPRSDVEIATDWQTKGRKPAKPAGR